MAEKKVAKAKKETNSTVEPQQEDKAYYTAKTTPAIVKFKKANYIAIQGKGQPGGKEFNAALEALYPVAFAIKAAAKAEGNDFTVAKLEGLWWVESDMPWDKVPRKEWLWKLMIRMPDFVNAKAVTAATKAVADKKGIALAKEVKNEKLNEGMSVQVLHVGPYSTEKKTVALMDMFIKDSKLVRNGLHHEIYLSDPRKTAPEKMKTILRTPVAKAPVAPAAVATPVA